MLLRELRILFESQHPRGVRDTTSSYLLACVQCFESHLGRPASTEDLSQQTVNAYVDWMAKNRSAATVRSQRCGLLMLWRFAAEIGITNWPGRIRSPRLPKRPVTAWTLDEIRTLRDYCLTLPGRFCNGLSVGIYFASLVSAGYETGFRLSDQLAIEKDWILTTPKGEGMLTINEAKTGKQARRVLTRETMQLIDRCLRDGPKRKTIWPLWGRRETFFTRFKSIVAAAGIREGTYKYLRRSACTDTEKQHRGNGQLFLNHSTNSVTRDSYLDQWQLTEDPIRVSPID